MQDLPVEFRSEIIKPLLKTLASGESCSLVGVGSSGKSNVVLHLLRADVREHYLGESARNTLCVRVDCAELSDYSIHSLQGLILEAVLHAVKQMGAGMDAIRQSLDQLWEQVTGTESQERTRRALEDAITRLLQAGVRQVYIILDDFDHVVQKAAPPTLNSLRALRDKHKYQVMYVAVTRRELAFLRNEHEFEDLYEIVCNETIPIGPYLEQDADFMADRLAARWGLPGQLSTDEKQCLRKASGCHAGLLRAILWSTQCVEHVPLTSPDLTEKLRGHRDIIPECIKIWESLEDREIANLVSLVGQGWPVDAGVEQLEAKGLARHNLDDTWEVFSPVLEDFVSARLPPRRFDVELEPEQVRVNGRLIKLEAVEFQLFACLYYQRGKLVPRQELIGQMIKSEAGQRRFPGSPEQRLEGYMAEVKRKINSIRQEFVVHAPNGYRLVDLDGK